MAAQLKVWTRWQDWVAAVVGLYALLSPLWLATNRSASTTLVVFGVLALAASVWSLAQPEAMSSEYAHMALGVLVFLAPWVLGYSDLMAASWTSWVAGVITVVMGALTVPAINKSHGAAMGH
jgi:hypothetical protein